MICARFLGRAAWTAGVMVVLWSVLAQEQVVGQRSETNEADIRLVFFQLGHYRPPPCSQQETLVRHLYYHHHCHHPHLQRPCLGADNVECCSTANMPVSDKPPHVYAATLPSFRHCPHHHHRKRAPTSLQIALRPASNRCGASIWVRSWIHRL